MHFKLKKKLHQNHDYNHLLTFFLAKLLICPVSFFQNFVIPFSIRKIKFLCVFILLCGMLKIDAKGSKDYYTDTNSLDGINEQIQNQRNSAATHIKYVKTYNESDKKYELNPKTQDIIYELRIAALNKQTPIELQYNDHVKRYINIYTTRRKTDFARILGLAELYFPIFEEMLDKYNLPLELKYLAIVESSLNPLAVSKSGAVGLWQFLYNTSKMFDIEINSYIDQRCDPYIATEAACRYLVYLYDTFHDWDLAIASFNGGPGVIRNAIERSGGKTDYWELLPYLTDQTRTYVPAFIATNYIMNFADKHDIKPVKPSFSYFETDTVKIKKDLHFQQISNILDIKMEHLRFLNPMFKRDYVPVTDLPVNLILPSNKIVKFIRKEEKIYAENIPKKDYFSAVHHNSVKNKIKIIHQVQKGEFFHKIALKYNCSIDNLKTWNGLTTDFLYPGQKLDIWIPRENLHLYTSSSHDQIIFDDNDSFIYYVVEEGDTIWSIAEKFNLESIDEIKKMNKGLDENDIQPGQKIKINW